MMMLKSFRSTEASSGEALNGDEICSLWGRLLLMLCLN
jgi:hypothetical protein